MIAQAQNVISRAVSRIARESAKNRMRKAIYDYHQAQAEIELSEFLVRWHNQNAANLRGDIATLNERLGL